MVRKTSSSLVGAAESPTSSTPRALDQSSRFLRSARGVSVAMTYVPSALDMAAGGGTGACWASENRRLPAVRG